jgi:multicomponent Na+:H+ antiporter subunit D
MTLASSLLPVTVLLPLGVAFVLLMFAHWLPPRSANLASIITSLLVAAICAWLARESLHGAVLHWFGGWTPQASHHPGVVLGVSFRADPASAAIAAFCGVIFAASFVFAWGYFDDVHSHFQVLMLLFLAAMAGFCLTHDLFNLFVWFELMSVAAFALTTYPLGESSLEGAFNFTITNALASFLMLAGIGLLYARSGTLDFGRMREVVSQAQFDPVFTAGFILLAAALLTKAAILPFHLWLSDAHAVAPSPVSVIFSGAMVSLGLFALAKIVTEIFAGDAAVIAIFKSFMLWLGLATAIIGGAMAWAQRHLKRMLAFSTIAHMGIMLTGLASLSSAGTAGFLLYIVAHGCVKAALFMVCGILLALCASGDEIVLYGKGNALWPAGLAMGLGGLLLGGLPIGLLHTATSLVHQTSARFDVAVGLWSGAMTGAAVLRACARIFLGWSGAPGPEAFAPTCREHERANRPLWLMLLPCCALLAVVFIPRGLIDPFLATAADRLLRSGDGSPLPVDAFSFASIAPVLMMMSIVGISLFRVRATRAPERRLRSIEMAPIKALRFLHSGLVGDYVAWIMLGLAALAAAFAS